MLRLGSDIAGHPPLVLVGPGAGGPTFAFAWRSLGIARDIIHRMKKAVVLPALLALGFSLCVIAQTEADYSGWMKDIAQTKGKVAKGVASKSAEVPADAEHLAGLFAKVAAFWQGRNASDAVTIAKGAESASNDLAAAAKAGDESKEQSDLQTINGACGMCHMAHRAGEKGNFSIK
jgi:cytochrome c556